MTDLRPIDFSVSLIPKMNFHWIFEFCLGPGFNDFWLIEIITLGSLALSVYSEVLIFIKGVQILIISSLDCFKANCISSNEFGPEKVALIFWQRISTSSNIALPWKSLSRIFHRSSYRMANFLGIRVGETLPWSIWVATPIIAQFARIQFFCTRW